MEKTIDFYYWFKHLGGAICHIEVTEVNQRLNNPDFKVSTLKQRAEEIKEKYNYKFN
ncbi:MULTISPECIES: hypothetical protein [Flavobacterium]|uniref:Uncharacterized protein n=1 Tax=Flavobacterium keumense TaxID=1306518 RepID=A0ABY8N4P2_9FLAO|nr:MULTISPECIES: hypothetical protein [Flavobacterium]WGK93826.1 hypothetical protein MG292_06905 [Flavobacterium keumense]